MTPVTARRALIVAFCFPPHAAIGTHRTLRLVSHLAAGGWDVDVLTARPEDYLDGTPVDPQLLTAVPSSAHVVRGRAFRGFSRFGRALRPLRQRSSRPAPPTPASASKTPPAPPTPTVKTLLEELVALPDKDVGWLIPAVTTGVQAFSFQRPDVIFSSAPPWTTHLVAGLLASALRRPWVADFRDPWVRSPWTRYRTRTAAAAAARLESWVVRRARAVVFTTDSARLEFAAHYGADIARRLHTVHNGCDAGEFPAVAPRASSDRFVLLHAGTLYGGRSPVPFLNALAMLRQRQPALANGLLVRFLGSTSFPGVDLGRTCAELGVTDLVEFLPRVDRARSLVAIRDASALMLLQSGTAMAIPGKLYEYLAAGRPILALCEPGEMADLIKAHDLGLVAAAADSSEIAAALETLLTAPAGRFVPAAPPLFDGRLRAAEMARVLDSAIGTDSRAPLAAVGNSGGPHA